MDCKPFSRKVHRVKILLGALMFAEHRIEAWDRWPMENMQEANQKSKLFSQSALNGRGRVCIKKPGIQRLVIWVAERDG
jgi:hypothetical protein